ncbi:MAG: metallophosphoesterase family protein [Pedosphaera sp.]|nr:metallophosphoesterase family protein [Pedosphaera sp.]
MPDIRLGLCYHFQMKIPLALGIPWLRLAFCLIGASVCRGDDASLIRVSDMWQYFYGVTEPTPLPRAWAQPGFVPGSEWQSGPSGFGGPYGSRSGEATPIIDRDYNFVSVYFRREFVVDDPASIQWLILRLQVQEGFVAYLNGREISRSGFASGPEDFVPFDTTAKVNSFPAPLDRDISLHRGLLHSGTNILAVQVHSSDIVAGFPLLRNGGNLLFLAELLANFNRGPFVQNMAAHQVQVLWKTPVPASGAVEFGTTTNLGQQVVLTNNVTDQRPLLEGLLPATRYYYRVRSRAGTNEAVSEMSSFRTFGTHGPLSFSVFGDSGGGNVNQFAIAKRILESGADFVLHTGDIVYNSFSTWFEDTRCLSVYRPHMRTIPYFFCAGNHDVVAENGLAFVETFAQPTNDVSLAEHLLDGTSPRHFYSFDAGDVHFVALYNPWFYYYQFTTNSSQYRWLERDLAATQKPWKVVFQHIPFQTSGPHYTDRSGGPPALYDWQRLQETLVPLLARHGVQLFFNGHEHFYERFTPFAGIQGITTGAGGVDLYNVYTRFPSSSQLFLDYHYVKVDIDGPEARIRAVNAAGDLLDEFQVRREPASRKTYAAAWESPTVETSGLQNPTGNLAGQTFDFAGESAPALAGNWANLGRLRVAVDETNLYLGLEHSLVPAGADVIMFLEVPGLAGVRTLAGLGNGKVDPAGQGVDALDALENLSFANFHPSVAVVGGDEFADENLRAFQRPAASWPMGQGVFRLDADLSSIAQARIQQFDRSPQTDLSRGEHNADFIEISIPRSQLGNLQVDDAIQVAAIAVFGPSESNVLSRWIDPGFIGTQMNGSGRNPVMLNGLLFQLPGDPDLDHDGVSNKDEIALETNPNNPDTDGDGLGEKWEILHGLDPKSGVGRDGGDGDWDGDRMNNRNEFLFGTDPRSAASTLRITSIRRVGDTLRLKWPAPPGARLILESSGQIEGGYAPDKSVLSVLPNTGNEQTVELVPDGAARFFRLRLEQ